jgi:hypothetical protein
MAAFARTAAVGALAALAYLAEQEVDRRLMNPRSDDLVLLGGLVTGRHRWWRPIGLTMHLTAGAVFALIFDRLVARRLVGPYWFRGVAFAQLENAALWPVLLLIDRFHPAVRRGVIAPTARPLYFAQSVLRHLALGSTLGLVPNRSSIGVNSDEVDAC